MLSGCGVRKKGTASLFPPVRRVDLRKVAEAKTGRQSPFFAILALLAVAAGTAAGQPALTTIQDILYRADGTRFTGTMFIRYNSFLAGDTSNIATANLTLPIVNGVLRVQLVPTTTASAGAQYTITYNSQGIDQFTEIWAVPPSTIPLRVRDVRVSSGTVIGPEPVLAPIQISDVTGLPNELSVRPMKGVGFGIGRAAVINQAGQIDSASGNLGDCVRVDGSSGPCGGGGGAPGGSFADAEIPAGAVNGSNTVFTLASTPSPASSLELYRNGLLMLQGADYQISARTITFFLASVPQTGDLLVASYRFANPNDPLSSLASPQVVCSSTGSSTSGTALVELGSCTIAGGIIGSGRPPGSPVPIRAHGYRDGFHGRRAGRRDHGRIASGRRDRSFTGRAYQLRDLRDRPDVGHPDLGSRAELGRECGNRRREYIAGCESEPAGANGGDDLGLSVLA